MSLGRRSRKLANAGTAERVVISRANAGVVLPMRGAARTQKGLAKAKGKTKEAARRRARQGSLHRSRKPRAKQRAKARAIVSALRKMEKKSPKAKR